MFDISLDGDFSKTKRYLKDLYKKDFSALLEKAGQAGVNALAEATPRESGRTAAAWGYKVERNGDSSTITWTNSHVEDGVPIAIILQYGHGTGTGGYVAGRNYINPAIGPIFDKIAVDIWREVLSLE